MKKLRAYFITGLVVIVPVFLTAYLFIFTFNFFDGILGVLLNKFIKNRWGFYIPGLGLFISLFITLLTGFLATQFIGKKIFSLLEKWLVSIPLIKKVYPAFKQLVLFIFAQQELGFKKVVLVEYPSKGIWSIGFLTNEAFKKINQLFDKETVPVFVPNSPGPFSGYVIFVPKEELKFPDISVSDALRIIISGGVLSLQGK